MAGSPVFGIGFQKGLEEGLGKGRGQGLIIGVVATTAIYGANELYSRYKQRKIEKLESERIEEILNRAHDSEGGDDGLENTD